MNIYKSSRAEIIAATANRIIRIIEADNPEEIFSKSLRDYFIEIGFSSMYPNFGHLNIGTVHPFIMLLFADVMGQKLNLNVFPSITVADSTQEDTSETLGREIEYINLTAADIAKFKGYVTASELFISDGGITLLESGTKGGNTLVGKKVTHTTRHSFDFNIWTDNKDVTSFIFDAVEAYLTSEVESLHGEGIDVMGKSGRRSSDVNFEFGKILYGANLTANVYIRHSSMAVNPVLDKIATIDVKTLPSYFLPGA